MEYEDPPSPPSRRHRRPPPVPKKNRVQQPSNDSATAQKSTEAVHRPYTAAEKGKGKAREPLEPLREEEEQVHQSTRGEQDQAGAGPAPSTSKAFQQTSSHSSLTPLDQVPSQSHEQIEGPALSQLFSSEPTKTPYRPRSNLTSSRSRKRSNGARTTSGSDETDYENPVTGSRKRPRGIKRVRSVRSKRTIWTQIRQGFGIGDGKENEGTNSDSDSSSSGTSIEKFRKEVLPLSTAIEKQRRARGENVDGAEEENASEYEMAEEPRRAFKRISTFLGGQDLHVMSKENKSRLLRKAPYRTSKTDAEPLEFVPPSQAGLGGSYDLSSYRGRQSKLQLEKEEKVKRLPVGRSPRTPFLDRMSQTDFAPLLDLQDEHQPGCLRPLSKPYVSDSEAARISKKGSGWVSTKRQLGPKRIKPRTNKKALIMVREEDAEDTGKIDPSFPLNARPKAKKIRKLAPPRPVKSKLRYIPARRPRPVRPFARRPPVRHEPEAEQSESIQTASASRSHRPRRSPAVSPRVQPITKAKKNTDFRFIVGPKAKKAPTVLVQETPSPLIPRQQRQETVSSSLPNLADLFKEGIGSERKAGRPPKELEKSLPQRNPSPPPPTKKKTTLMRRLSTLPGGRFGVDELQIVKKEVPAIVIEPSASFNHYNHSSHSNSLKSRLESLQPPVLPTPVDPVYPSHNPESALPPAHQHTATLLPRSRSKAVKSSQLLAIDLLASTSSSTSSNPVILANSIRSRASNALDPISAATRGGGGGNWWMSGPTFSAAVRQGGRENEELDLAALRRGNEESSGTFFSSLGEEALSIVGLEREAQREGDEEHVGNETEVWHSSLLGALGGEEYRGRIEEEEEEPPKSILMALED